MRRDHRPYWLRRVMAAHEAWHARHFLFPAFDAVGRGCSVAKPWHVHVFGAQIHLGAHVEIRATPSQNVRFTTWPHAEGQGRITIGDCCLIGPGVRIQSALSVDLQDAAMLASGVLISDADWHDVYDRLSAPGHMAPVVVGENAWVGDGAILLKGSRIGRNSIVGAGSVVSGHVPDNTIVAGNPARPVRTLDPDQPITTRRMLYADPDELAARTDAIYRHVLQGNNAAGWLRATLFPRRGD